MVKYVSVRHDYSMNEYEIEDILIDNPYLIRKDYHSVTRQVKFRDRTRADIIFYGDPVLVVELKRGTLMSKNVTQIEGYMNNLKEEGYNDVEGELVGTDFGPEVTNRILELALPITIKRLGIDIPTDLQKCSKCDQYSGTNNSRCPYCGSRRLRYWDPVEGKLVSE